MNWDPFDCIINLFFVFIHSTKPRGQRNCKPSWPRRAPKRAKSESLRMIHAIEDTNCIYANPNRQTSQNHSTVFSESSAKCAEAVAAAAFNFRIRFRMPTIAWSYWFLFVENCYLNEYVTRGVVQREINKVNNCLNMNRLYSSNLMLLSYFA